MKEILLINPKRRGRPKKRATGKKRPARKTGRRVTRRRTPAKRTTKRRNPKKAAPSRRTTTQRRSSTMAKKRTTKKRKAPRRNPRRRTYRRAVTKARTTFAGLNVKSALKDVPLTQIGMFATKWLAKRFGPDATETDPESWNWSSYVKGGLGAVLAGFIAQMVKPGCGQKVLGGGLNLVVYKLIQNELIAGNDWAEDQFGQQDEEGYLPGDVEDDEYGNSYLLGDNGQWQPLPSAGSGVNPALQRVGPLGALDPLSRPGPLGQDPVAAALLDA